MARGQECHHFDGGGGMHPRVAHLLYEAYVYYLLKHSSARFHSRRWHGREQPYDTVVSEQCFLASVRGIFHALFDFVLRSNSAKIHS